MIAEKLGNRGPVKFGNDGKLTTDILDAFWRTGFYVFEGLVDKDEIALLQADMQALLDRVFGYRPVSEVRKKIFS